MALSQVFNIDCLEGMKQYPDKYFELAIVDPEYGLDVGNMKMGHKKGQDKITKYVKKDWDVKPAGGDYFNEIFRVSINQIIWGGNYFVQHLPVNKAWIVWDKMQPEGVTFSMHELAFTSFDGQARIFRKSFASSCNKVANNNKLAQIYAKIHPAQKPVELYKWLLKNYANPGDKILDTHLGSGSSRIAAYDMGFDFTGYEIDKDYFEAQEKRFQTHIRQLDLFKEGSQQKPTFTQLTID